MNTLFTLLVTAAVFGCIALAISGAKRLWSRIESDGQFLSDHYLKFLIAIAAMFAAFNWLGSKWIDFLTVTSGLVIVLAAYEYKQAENENQETKNKIDEAIQLRKERLLSGEGWTKHDVLQKYKTTLFYRQFGRLTTTTGWRCAGCSKNLYKEKDAELDHIQPRSKYPTLAMSESNLQILCRSCNAHKHAYDGDDWKKTIHKRRRVSNKKTRGARIANR